MSVDVRIGRAASAAAASSILRLTCSVALLTAMVAPGCNTPATAAPEQDRGGAAAPHGAAGMDKQAAALSELVVHPDPALPPAGVDPVIWAASIPADNQTTAARVELGRALYFDVRLSADGTVACATCHDVTRGFTDQRPVSEGIGGKLGRRNAPTTLNAALLDSMFLDGRVRTLEEQARLPITNLIEMGHPSAQAAVAAISGDADYRRMFQAAYGRGVSFEDIGRALAAFERTLVFLQSPFDRFIAGDTTALSAQARRGWALFNGKARCVTCHPMSVANPLGTDNRFHNIGVSARTVDFESLAAKALVAVREDPSLAKLEELALASDLSELGRFMVSKQAADIGAFRTSQLRNIGITGPYMHDGSLQTLWDVIDHYNKGGEANPYLDGGMEPLALSEDEIDELVAFMFALTDDRLSAQNQAQMSTQRTRASSTRPFRDNDLAQRRRLSFEPRAN